MPRSLYINFISSSFSPDLEEEYSREVCWGGEEKRRGCAKLLSALIAKEGVQSNHDSCFS